MVGGGEISTETYIITAQDANDFPAAVQLDEEALVEVLDSDNRVSESCMVDGARRD